VLGLHQTFPVTSDECLPTEPMRLAYHYLSSLVEVDDRVGCVKEKPEIAEQRADRAEKLLE
jgi:hypothetical protein